MLSESLIISTTELLNYFLPSPEETLILTRMRALLRNEKASNPFDRTNFANGHFTASTFVVVPAERVVLLIWHEKLQKWLQPGGHVELEDATLAATAARELAEETGSAPADFARAELFDIDTHEIAHGAPQVHTHFDVRFLYACATRPQVTAGRWWQWDEALRAWGAAAGLARPLKKIQARFG